MSRSGPLRLRFGPYRCIAVMGVGANHTLYHALHEESGDLVALRVLPLVRDQYIELLGDCLDWLARVDEIVTQTITEIDAQWPVDVQPAAVVPMLDYGHHENNLYLVMPVMKGRSLAARLDQYQAADVSLPSPRDVGAMVQRLAAVLDVLHDQGLVHGDIDPRNIFFDKQGRAYLGDIGLMRLLKLIFRLGTTGSLDMSAYAAPEIWQGERPQPASDQYALACIAYHLLTGQPPFQGQSIYALMKQHTDEAAMPPHLIDRDLPESLAVPFWQALAKPMQRRYPSVTAFATELRNFLPAESVDAQHVSPFFTFSLTTDSLT